MPARDCSSWHFRPYLEFDKSCNPCTQMSQYLGDEQEPAYSRHAFKQWQLDKQPCQSPCARQSDSARPWARTDREGARGGAAAVVQDTAGHARNRARREACEGRGESRSDEKAVATGETACTSWCLLMQLTLECSYDARKDDVGRITTGESRREGCRADASRSGGTHQSRGAFLPPKHSSRCQSEQTAHEQLRLIRPWSPNTKHQLIQARGQRPLL